MVPISDLELYILAAGVYNLVVYILVPPISDLELYLLAVGVYTVGVYSLVLPMSDLELYLLAVGACKDFGRRKWGSMTK